MVSGSGLFKFLVFVDYKMQLEKSSLIKEGIFKKLDYVEQQIPLKTKENLKLFLVIKSMHVPGR